MGSEAKRVGPLHVKTCEHGVRKCEQCVFEDWKRSLATPTSAADRLASAPLGTKAPAVGGGHWVKVAAGWQWFNGGTFPTPGGDWDGTLAYPTPAADEEADDAYSIVLRARDAALHENDIAAANALTSVMTQLAALRARPLPADVQAVLGRLRDFIDAIGDHDAVIRVEMGDGRTAEMSTAWLTPLLAHLQRTEGARDA